jgi:hypothetical protein
MEKHGNKMETRMTELEARVKELEAKIAEIENRKGSSTKELKSTRQMTEADAERVMTGDLKDAKIKDAAVTLGLSYGQIYSARGGYTFKTQYAAREAAIKATKESAKK